MKTFKEWWIEYRGFDDPHDGVAKDAWNAGLENAEIWMAYCHDRHLDPECFFFTDRQYAIDVARRYMQEHVAHPEHLKESDDGEQWRMTYGYESDYAYVILALSGVKHLDE